MNRRLRHDIEDWLTAERDGADELSDRALARAVARLERRRPSAGFADRVLLRAGIAVPGTGVTGPALWRHRWLQGTVAACLVGAGLALAALPLIWLVLTPLVHAVGSPMIASLSHAGSRWLASVLSCWAVVAQIGTALRAALLTPTAMLLVTANLLLALASLFGLKRLLKAPEELMPW